MAKACCAAVQSNLPPIFTPFQFGVGCKGGAEAIVHAARALVEEHPDFGLLALDFENAFNTVSRDCVLNAQAAFALLIA